MKKTNVYTITDFANDFNHNQNPDWATYSKERRNSDAVSHIFACDQYLAFVKGNRGPYMHDFTLVRLTEVIREGKTLVAL